MKRMHRVVLAILVTALIGLLAAKALSYYLHDHWDHHVELILADGTTLNVHHQGSKWHYFSGGHGFGFGGGDLHERLEFERRDRKFVWEGIYEPIALQFDGEVPVIIVFDRESPYSEWGLRYYRKDGDWRELPLISFPHRIALLNMWGHDPDQVADCDPDNPHFQDSLTAHLWLCIATNKHYQDIMHTNATVEFLNEFKQSMLQ